eukprot:jgi/Picre1/29602/NNA_004987.t1
MFSRGDCMASKTSYAKQTSRGRSPIGYSDQSDPIAIGHRVSQELEGPGAIVITTPNSSDAPEIFDLTGAGDDTGVPKEDVDAAIAQKSRASKTDDQMSLDKTKEQKGPVLKQNFGEGWPYAKEAVAAVDEAVKLLPENAKDLKMTLLSEASYIGRAPDEPKMRGTKDKAPIGHPDALSGKSFVITGVLDSMLRPEMEEYIRTHGGRVLSSVSGKTSFLIVGEHSGKSKVETAKSKGVKLIDEDGLISLVIASIPAKQSAETGKKDGIGEIYDKGKAAGSVVENSSRVKSDGSELLWVDKWKPKSSSELVGNNALISDLKSWLKQWKMCIYMGEGHSMRKGKRQGKRLCLIMDEVDGMSAGDRGGVSDLIRTIAKSKVPIIAVCNDKYSMKLKSLRNHCMELDFRKPTLQQIQKRISMICQKEGLHMNEATMHAVIQNANGGDIRAILGRLQMIRRRTDHLSYTDLSNDASKDVEMSPFEAAKTSP